MYQGLQISLLIKNWLFLIPEIKSKDSSIFFTLKIVRAKHKELSELERPVWARSSRDTVRNNLRKP